MNIRRFYIPDGVYFITAVTRDRKPIFLHQKNALILLATLSNVKKYYPHHLHAYVIVPDHFHFLIQPIESNISKLIQSLKRNFTNNYKMDYGITLKLSLWQHRFYDHVIRNEKDFSRHMDYIHYNPVKHGLVNKPEQWPSSSYHECMKKQFYEIGWD